MYCLVSEKSLRLVYGTFYLAIGDTFLAIGDTFYKFIKIDGHAKPMGTGSRGYPAGGCLFSVFIRVISFN